jgi:hypothetical protein
VAASLLKAKRRKREKYHKREAMLAGSHRVTDIVGLSTPQAAPPAIQELEAVQSPVAFKTQYGVWRSVPGPRPNAT